MSLTDPIRLPRALPRGAHSLPREVVLLSQKERLLEAVIAAVAEQGYAAVTLAGIVTRAGVSRSTFYDHFPGKEECYLAAYMAGSRTLFGQVSAAGRDVLDPVERIRLGTRAYLESIASEPQWARAGFVEVAAAGAAAEARRTEVMGWYVDLLRDWHAWASRRLKPIGPVPAAAFEASVHAVNELVANHVRAGALTLLPGLVRTVMYIELSLLALPEEAQRVADGEL